MNDSDPDEDTSPEGPFDFPDQDEGPTPPPDWLGAVGQMVAALVAVFGVIALLMGTAVLFRRLWP